MAELIPPGSDIPVMEVEHSFTPVVVHPHPFSVTTNRIEVREGATLSEIVAQTGIGAEAHGFLRVFIGDHEIPRHLWPKIKPRNGAHVFVRSMPMGGGGDNGGKSLVSSLLMLAVVVASAVFAPIVAGALFPSLSGVGLQIATGLIGAGISMVGALLVSSLIPPPSQPGVGQRALLSGVRNQFAPYADVPRHMGRRRVYPLQAAHPYTEAQGKDRFVRVLLAVGQGPLKISDVKIGDTPIEVYDAITYQTREGWHADHFSFGRPALQPAWAEEFNGSATGWTSANSTITQNATSITITPTATNQALSSPVVAIDGTVNRKVRVRLRRLSGTNWDGSLLYKANGRSTFNLSYYKQIPSPIVTNGEWVIAEWDMAALTAGGTDWITSTITQMRFDFTWAVASVYEVDWIQVGAEIQADTPQTIFTMSVSEESFNILLDDAGVDGGGAAIDTPGEWQVRTTEENCSEISIDVTFPLGLAEYKSDGDVREITVQVEVQYSPAGANTWVAVDWAGNDEADGTDEDGKIIGKDASRAPTSRGGRWIVPTPGKYDVRLRRITKRLNPIKNYAQRVEWTALRSIKAENPVNLPGMALIALRMKATDQLNGLPDTINCVVESYLPEWDGANWTWGLSRSPAWAYADVMRRRFTSRMIADQRIDTSTMRQWDNACRALAPNAAEAYWEFNGSVERGSMFDTMRLIASHGRASFTIRDGKYSVVRDILQTVPVQHITPRNSWGYSGSKAFIDQPHALKVQFINAANGYQEDEVIVYADGYSETNATRFETLDMPGCTSPTQAWREGRYHIAVGQLRPEEHQVSMDIEALRCTLGDYVLLSHDVLSIGIAAARITARQTSGSNITGVTIDATVPWRNGKNYGLRVRLQDGSSALYAVQVNTGSSQNLSTLTFATPIPTSGGPQVGDLAIYGITGLETAPMLVKKIDPGPNMTARLTLVDAQPGVWTADTDAIPPFQTYVTNDTPVPQRRPDAPSFSLVSDESVLLRLADGTLQDRIGVTIKPLPSSVVPVTEYEVQFRRSDENEWKQALVSKISVRQTYVAPVVQGVAYDVRVRSISRFGQASDWTTEAGHVVIGKTTPPSDVLGFSAQSRVDGIQLSWEPNSEIDIASYTIKLGEDWDTAQRISKNFTGTSLFVGIDTAEDQTFLIRAVDVIGLESATPASVVASVSRPDDVPILRVYPQNDSIQFSWRRVAGAGVQYEIRNGSDWPTARRVTVASGDSITVKWPIIATSSRVFMIRAVSAAGLKSLNPTYGTAPQQPMSNRNVVLETNFSSDSWAGTLVGFDVVGSGLGSTLAVGKAWDGLSFARADYYRSVALPANFYARNWVETAAVATSGAGTTWRQAKFPWSDAAGVTWAGSVVGDIDVEITPYIAVQDATSVPASLVEAFRLNGSMTGHFGTTPNLVGVEAYGPMRGGSGLKGDQTQASWIVTTPSVYTATIDFRFAPSLDDYTLFVMGVPADPRTNPDSAAQKAGRFTIMRLQNVGASVNNIVDYDGATGELVMTATGQPDAAVAMPLEEGDLVTVSITQTASDRTLMAYHHRLGEFFSVTIAQAPVGSFNRFRLYSSASTLPGTFGNAEIHNVSTTFAAFQATAPMRAPVGFQPYKELVPGDYGYQNAILWLAAELPTRSIDVAVAPTTLRVDVPDLLQRGTVSVPSGGVSITYGTAFKAAPDLAVTQVGGATLAIIRVTAASATGFTVQMFDAAAPATAVAGTISYQAIGY